MSAISGTGSMLVVEVVPTVATTASGRTPAARSASTASASRSERMRRSSSVAILVRPSRPMPSVMQALSTDEWASADAYTRSGGRSALPAIPRVRMSSPAASRAHARPYIVEVDAVSVISPNQPAGSPSRSSTHASVRCSSSVAAGEVRHSIAFTLRALAISSPTMPGPLPVMPK